MFPKRRGGIVTASKIMGAAIPVLSALLLGGTGVATAASSQQFVDEAEIQKLTVNYAKATDALGTGEADQLAVALKVLDTLSETVISHGILLAVVLT